MQISKTKIVACLLLFSGLMLNFRCDPCKDTDCGEHGTCMEGLCNCMDGYRSEKCDSLTMLRYKGRFVGTEKRDSLTNLPMDFTFAQTNDVAVCKITINNNVAADFSVPGYSFTPKQTYLLDSTHTLISLNTQIDAKNDTINYTASYKVTGITGEVSYNGKLVRVP